MASRPSACSRPAPKARWWRRCARWGAPRTRRILTSDTPRLATSCTCSPSLDAVVLPTDPVLGATTVNIGMLSGGLAENVVAPSAEARLMVRLVGPSGTVESRLRDWAEPKGSLDFTRLVPPVHLTTVPGFETGVVAFATDIPRLTNWGTPYLFGPGSIHVAHTDHEFVSAADLVRAVDDYVRLAARPSRPPKRPRLRRCRLA